MTSSSNDDDQDRDDQNQDDLTAESEDADGDIEPYLLFRDFDLTDSDMALLLEFSMISLMSDDETHSEKMADMLEAVHPHHASSFIVRGLRAQSKGEYSEAVEMFITGIQARFKGAEAAALCLNLLHEIGLEESETATAIHAVLQETEIGRQYLAQAMEALKTRAGQDDSDNEEEVVDAMPAPRPVLTVHDSQS